MNLKSGGTLHLFDGTTEPPEDGKHGKLGVDHAATVPVDYFYQAEQWMIDMPEFDPKIIRGELHRNVVVVAVWKKNEAGIFNRSG